MKPITSPLPRVRHSRRAWAALLLVLAWSPFALSAQGITDGSSNTILIGEGSRFDNGSSGALGDLVIDTDSTRELPADGILHVKSLKVASGKTLRFKRNAFNTPAYVLAQGDIVVDGTIDVSGSTSPGDTPTGGVAGPGGFDGGKPGFGEVPPGAGYGPGGGKGGATDSHAAGGAGSGSYATVSDVWRNANKGSAYGNALLVPLVGGSGGGGTTGSPGRGGGGGGGALLLSSNTRIQLAGKILSIGGNAAGAGGNVGSGGAVRLVAPVVAGTGEINVFAPNNYGGRGRIRVDTLNRDELRLNFQPLDALSVGANLFVFPPIVPALDIVEIAGTAIPDGSGPVTVQLPFGSSPSRTIKVRASNWGRVVPIQVVLTPDSGVPTTINAEIDNSLRVAVTVDLPVVLPINTLVTVQCWSRSVNN